MENVLNDYIPAVASIGVIGGLLLLQLLVADVIGILKKHVPGTPVPADHQSLLFRAHRAHANTNESVAAFLALTLFALAVSATPSWLNTLCLAYVVGRVGHMACYYANLKLLRSIFFALGTLALIGILVIAIAAS
jgi:uncharacterized MAPEG superfamily protein